MNDQVGKLNLYWGSGRAAALALGLWSAGCGPGPESDTGDVAVQLPLALLDDSSPFSLDELDGFENPSEWLASNLTVTSVQQQGIGTLSHAIEFANTIPGTNTIRFDIPGDGPHTIVPPLTGFPTIVDPIVIDGYTQPLSATATESAPADLRIVIDGNLAPPELLYLDTNDSTVRGLVLQRGAFSAVRIAGNRNAVAGCHVGVDAVGTTAQTSREGIWIEGNANRVGGTLPRQRNVIKSGLGFGVAALGNGNRIVGNFIGTDARGEQGIYVYQATGVLLAGSENIVGGGTPAERNVISGNHFGVRVAGADNVVQGNYVGVDVSGSLALPNQYGIDVFGPDNLIGGSTEGQGNVISGNYYDGLKVAEERNVIQGNLVGTDASGQLALGNGANGISLTEYSHLVGGPTAAAANVIAANGSDGISMSDLLAASQGHKLAGNFIGTDRTGTLELGNGGAGIRINGSDDSTIDGNTIAFNADDAVQVLDGVGNAILNNSSYENGGLAIDLNNDGPTPNDTALDSDTGPNNLQNTVRDVIAYLIDGELLIYATLQTGANGEYHIEVFYGDGCGSSSDAGYARQFLGDHGPVSTNASGTIDMSFSLPAPDVAVGAGVAITVSEFVNADIRSTSEFSECVPVIDQF